MMFKKRLMAILLATAMVSTSIPVSAEETTVETETESLTPSDLNFRKYFTGRNLFDSELPISELDLQSIENAESEVFYGDGRLTVANSQEENVRQKFLIGDMTPFSVYDLSVTEQTPSKDGAAMTGLIWEKDKDNSIALRKATVAGDMEEEETVVTELISSLNMKDETLLENATTSTETSVVCAWEKVDGGVKVVGNSAGTGEGYLHVGKVVQNSYIEATISEQIKNTYTANAIIKIKGPGTDGKNNGIFVAQRTNGTLTVEVFVEGSSKLSTTISSTGVAAPYDLRVGVDGNIVTVTRIKDGEVSATGTVDVSSIYDFTADDGLDGFEYTIGGRLANGEHVIYTKAEIYKIDDEKILSSIDMTDADILSKVSVYDDISPYNSVSKTEEGITFTAKGNKGETFVSAGALQNGTVLEATITEQNVSAYTASAILKFRDKTADNSKSTGIFFTQRAAAAGNKSMALEVIVGGSVKHSATLATDAVTYPYKLRMALDGSTVVVSRVVDSEEQHLTKLDVSQWFDLSDPDVLANFEATFGAKLGTNESMTYSSVVIKEYPITPVEEETTEVEEVITSLDMTDADLLNKLTVYHDLSPYNTASKSEGGITFTANGNKGESFALVGALQDGTVLEAEVSAQNKSAYTASALLKFRDKTADNSKSNGIYLTQRVAGNFTLEVIVGGSSVKNIVIASNTVACPYKLRLALNGSVVTASRVINGVEEGITSLDVSEWFDLSDSKVLANFEATIGAKLGTNESMTYSYAALKKLNEQEEVEEIELPTTDSGFILQVKKSGTTVVDKVITYPTAISKNEPFTMRAHWAGQYLSIWFVQNGKPYLMATENMGNYFDMRDETVFPDFKAYAETVLSSGSSLEISEARNYYTGGDGQADPKPLHYKDGTVIVEDGKMWISMTLRGYAALPASCQAIYSLDLETYELELINITTFRKPNQTKHMGYHASDFCYDEDTGEWLIVTSSHGDDKLIRTGKTTTDPRTVPYLVVDVDVLSYAEGTRSDYEDPSIIYNEELGKWHIASCASGTGGYNVALLEADNFDGPYSEVAVYTSGSCTGILIQKVGGEYYVFTGRSPRGNGVGAMNLEALNYPEMTKNTSLKMDGETDSYNPWPMLFPLVNEEGETVYRLLTFDRDSMITNDGSMAGGQYTYGRIYLYEALEKENSKDVLPEKPEVTAENTEVITTPEELWAISENLGGSYTLGANIDMSGYEWYPIGTEDAPFTGTFDGAGYCIKGLTASETKDMTGVGLFGYTSDTAVIKNVNIMEANVSGRIYTGALVGKNLGTISNCTATGTVTGESETGLLAGRNMGTVEYCTVSGTVVGTGNDSTGGLLGANSTGTIKESRAEVTVTGTVNVGGLVGYNDRGTIQNTYATGTVTGKNYVGGLVGQSGASGYTKTCTISNSYADCVVNGKTAGSLVGFNDKDVANSFGTGSVTGTFVTGSLIGRNNQYGNVKNSYANSTVTGSSYVGALFGKNTGNYSNVAITATGTAIANSPDTVVSNEVPDFTSATTYATGVLKEWDEAIWQTGEGLPILLNAAELPDMPVFKTKLLAAIKDAKALEEDDYSAETWAVLADAIAAAELVVANEDATQVEVDAATAAIVEAKEALVTILEAVRAAEAAAKAAQEAAEAARDEANTAKAEAQDAQAAAETAKAEAEAAQAEAEGAKAAAEEAENAAEEAQKKAEAAQAAADAAAANAAEDQEAAEAAKVAAEAAQKEAEEAKVAAETAKAEAEAAQAAAEAAQEEADAAKVEAETAKTEAEAAEAAAKTAQEAAEEAQAAAEESANAAEQSNIEAAEEAAKAAEESAKAAEEANKAAEEAAKAAAEATKATEESAKAAAEAGKAAEESAKAAAEAQKATEAAQLAAGYAAQAAEALAKAQEAQAKAEAAQKAAEDAQKVAEAAQKAAEEAKKAAEEAQKKAEDNANSTEEDKKAAEDAQKAAEDTKKAAEDAKKAAEDAQNKADFAAAKQAAMLELASYTGKDAMSPAQLSAYDAVVTEAIAAINAATSVEELKEIMEAVASEVTVIENAPSVNRFVDVVKDDWFYDIVDYVAYNGLMTGMDETHFGPYESLSRAQFALILYRMLPEHTVSDVQSTENQGMEGKPEVKIDKSFEDILGDEWYGEAVLWAAEAGIVTGYENGYYGPADMITREQMAVMMYRYANYLGMNTSNEGYYSDFLDAESVSEFAADAMKWAVAEGIITGKEEGTMLAPQANTARAEAAAIMERFMTAYAE